MHLVSKRLILKQVNYIIIYGVIDLVCFVFVFDFSCVVNGELPQSVLKNLRWIMQKVFERTVH